MTPSRGLGEECSAAHELDHCRSHINIYYPSMISESCSLAFHAQPYASQIFLSRAVPSTRLP